MSFYKLFLFSKYLNFCWLFWSYCKWFNKNVKAKLKFFDSKDWETGNYNAHIAQYHKK